MWPESGAGPEHIAKQLPHLVAAAATGKQDENLEPRLANKPIRQCVCVCVCVCVALATADFILVCDTLAEDITFV